jgi:N-acetylglutamate synthase-like GNAT family acetyltransferase
VIRAALPDDFERILAIINDAAQAYRDVIPDDCWHEPYMSASALRSEIADGVRFWVLEDGQAIQGVMGIQDRQDVTLVRHAYTATAVRHRGIGSQLLRHLESLTAQPMLIGTWAAAVWAIHFYCNRGYRVVAPAEKDRLLQRYWRVPERQRDASVVLADSRWPGAA